MSRLPAFLVDRYKLWEYEVHIQLVGEEWMPLSVNKMYEPRRGKGGKRTGGLKITTEGRTYINKLRMGMAMQLEFLDLPRWIYHFHMFTLHPSIVSKGFVEEAERAARVGRPMKTTRKEKNKNTGEYDIKPAYTDILVDRDADGPLKKVQDVAFEVLGIRDNAAMVSMGGKVPTPPGDNRPGMEIFLVPFTEEETRYMLQVSDVAFQSWRDKPK